MKKIIQIISEYFVKQFFIALIVSIIAGVGIYSIQKENDKENKTKEVVFEILAIYSEMDYEISNEFMELTIDQVKIKNKILEAKAKKHQEKLQPTCTSSVNYEYFPFFLEYMEKYMKKSIDFSPYKNKLDNKYSLLEIYNPELYEKLKENLYKTEWALINLRKSNFSDFNQSMSKSLEIISNIDFDTIKDSEIEPLINKVFGSFFSKNEATKHMNEFNLNTKYIKATLLEYLKKENEQSAIRKLVNVFFQ